MAGSPSLEDEFFNDILKLPGNVLALQNSSLFAPDINRCNRAFAGAGEAHADVGLTAFAGSVHHAAHDGDLHRFRPRAEAPPFGRPAPQVALRLFGKLLKEVGRGPPAPRAARHHGGEGAKIHRLENLLRDDHLFRSRRTRSGRQGNADRVADSFFKQDGESGR